MTGTTAVVAEGAELMLAEVSFALDVETLKTFGDGTKLPGVTLTDVSLVLAVVAFVVAVSFNPEGVKGPNVG